MLFDRWRKRIYNGFWWFLQGLCSFTYTIHHPANRNVGLHIKLDPFFLCIT